ncbi:MAG: hypothetical protein H6747_13320 [Deltaproteobacteria bacterium]|nr:hypothetical protein [Deltaproteobacteria bacterium]
MHAPPRPAPLAALVVGFCVVALGCRTPPPDDWGDSDTASTAAADAADIDAGTDDGAGVETIASPTLELPSLDGPCTPGATRCAGVELDTCAPAGDGWVRGACFPGTFCQEGACVPIGSNLVIVFDTSGSMSSAVPGVACDQAGFPSCEPAKGCSRMDVAKVVFGKVLAAIDPQRVRMALFHFPSRLARTAADGCDAGYQIGDFSIAADNGAHSISEKTGWYWGFLHEILSVAFPRTVAESAATPAAIGQWMDGVETLGPPVGACAGPPDGCTPALGCGVGTCCSGSCYAPANPELRAVGGTPIGKTLFYVGEYLRHRVVVDGRSCAVDGDCGTPFHRCTGGVCVDPARACRETVVVVFTDGGEANDPKAYFSPLPMAKRLAYGLHCGADADCVGGASCVGGRCLVPNASGHRCLSTGAPCQPNAPVGDPLHCPASSNVLTRCEPDPLPDQIAGSSITAANVLRSPDGRPFGVRVQVVDVSGSATIPESFDLASAGGGRVFTADTADPNALLSALSAAFDLKNKKVCGNVQ